MSRWKVQKIGDMWEATDPTGEYTQAFLWWDMAVAYADSLARTIEVTLPRVAPHPDYGYLVNADDPWVYSWDGCWHLAPIGDWDGHAALLCNDRGEYKIHDDELRPLALALLALARRKETA